MFWASKLPSAALVDPESPESNTLRADRKGRNAGLSGPESTSGQVESGGKRICAPLDTMIFR